MTCLQEQIGAVVAAALSAGQHQILEQQLVEAVLTIQSAANDIQPVADRRSKQLDIIIAPYDLRVHCQHLTN